MRFSCLNGNLDTDVALFNDISKNFPLRIHELYIVVVFQQMFFFLEIYIFLRKHVLVIVSCSQQLSYVLFVSDFLAAFPSPLPI